MKYLQQQIKRLKRENEFYEEKLRGKETEKGKGGLADWVSKMGACLVAGYFGTPVAGGLCAAVFGAKHILSD